MLGDNMTPVLIFSSICLLLLSYVTYHVYKKIKADDEEIHQLAATARNNGASSLD